MVAKQARTGANRAIAQATARAEAGSRQQLTAAKPPRTRPPSPRGAGGSRARRVAGHTGIPGGPRISIPYCGGQLHHRPHVGRHGRGRRDLEPGGGLAEPARMNFSKPAGSVTSRKRARSELTMNVCGTSRGPYTNEPAGARDDPSADPEGQLAVDHVEPLVFVVMHVQGDPLPAEPLVLRSPRPGRPWISLVDLTVARTPRNHSASPSPGPSAIGASASDVDRAGVFAAGLLKLFIACLLRRVGGGTKFVGWPRPRPSLGYGDISRAEWISRHPTGEDRGDFTADDAAALASVTGAIADGILTSLRFDAAREALDTSAPGLVVPRSPRRDRDDHARGARAPRRDCESHAVGPDVAVAVARARRVRSQ